MQSSRRDIFTGISLLGSTALSSPARSQSRKEVGNDYEYRCELPGAIWRGLSDRLSETVSVLDFGALGNGVTDDTSAFQKAADAAAVAGKSLFVPATRRGYLLTDTVELRVRRIYGESDFIDSGNPGTLVLFKPHVTVDMKPCFAIVGGMYAAGLIENMNVSGSETYRRAELSRWVQPSQLPNYSAFAAGPCAFAVFGGNQPTFRNVSTGGVKAGLYLDSTDGHVSSYDCSWNGLFGVYCHRNSEDYFFLGGGITGVWASVVFGTFEHANHIGGMHITAYRVHIGFTPYAFYQVKDANFSGRAASLYGRLDVVRFEQIGEAILCFLPESITDALMVDSFAFSWSPVYRGFPTNPNPWLTNLPPDILAYEEQQQFALRLGTLAGDVKLGWLGGAWPLRRSANARQSAGVALIEHMDLKYDADISALHADFVLRNPATPNSWTRRRDSPSATKIDLALDADVTPSANLLRNPEETASWVRRGSIDEELSLSLVSLADAASSAPLALLEELGSHPTVLKVVASRAGTFHLALPFANKNAQIGRRNICLTMWVYGGRVRVRLEVAPDRFLYDTTYVATTAWTKVVCVDQTSGDVLPQELQIFSDETAPVFLCGVMACLDIPRPYTPLSVPRLRHGLALEGAETSHDSPDSGRAAILPHAPAGYLTVNINGADRKIPYY